MFLPSPTVKGKGEVHPRSDHEGPVGSTGIVHRPLPLPKCDVRSKGGRNSAPHPPLLREGGSVSPGYQLGDREAGVRFLVGGNRLLCSSHRPHLFGGLTSFFPSHVARPGPKTEPLNYI